MSVAESTAQRLYESMHLGSYSEDVKRHLMILILSGASTGRSTGQSICVPNSMEEVTNLGAVTLEEARQELHVYVDELAQEFDLR